MPELATNDQRWTIINLFSHFGVRDLEQVKADAARILKLDGLADLRELTRQDAAELIAELRRARSQERISNE